MRQSLLNHQPESRSCAKRKTWQQNTVTRILLALFALLSIPQGISADDYPLTIGNTQVTSDNANNLLDGKASFVFNATDASGTLTLNNATITGGIEWRGGNLTIKLNGENSITNTSGDAIKVNTTGVAGSSLSIVKSALDAKCRLILTSSADLSDGNNSLKYQPIRGFSNINTDIEYLQNRVNTGTEIFTSYLFGGGDGTSSKPYLITTPQDLMDLATYVNRGLFDTYGIFFKLEKDLDCKDLNDYEPIGYRKYAFKYSLNINATFDGTFDGGNYAIRNLNYNSSVIDQQTYDGICLFSYLNGTLKNLTLDNCKLGGGYCNGAITDFLIGTIDNCTISSCTIEGNDRNSGIAGYVDGLATPTYIKNCSVINCTIQNGNALGGIAGFTTGGVYIQNCTVNGGSIKTTEENASIGGIVAENGESVTGCIIKGGTSIIAGSNSYVGAIAPYSNGTLTDNYYYGNVTVKTGETILSGHTQRGTGYYDNQQNYVHTDVNGAKLYTKQLSFPSDNHCSVAEVAGKYYEKIGTGVISVAPGLTTELTVTPIGDYVPTTVTVTYTPTGGAQQTITPTKASGSYTYSFEMPDAAATFNVTSATNLESNSFSYQITKPVYTGSAVVLPSTISMTGATTGVGITLTQGTDYTIEGYKDRNKVALNSAPVNVDLYYVTIKGKGNYTGTVDVAFSLDRADLGNVTISAIADQTYTGNYIEPTFTVTFNGKTVNTDEYVVAYTNNKDVSTANTKATVTLTSNVRNFMPNTSKTTTFNIVKATPTVTAPTAKSLSYTGNAQELVNAGKTTAGTLQYKLGANGTYGTAIPSATNAGSYAVYYKVVGNSNINDVAEAGPINITIAKAAAAISFATASVGKTFGDAAFTNALTNTGDGAVTFASNNTAVATVNATTGSVNIVGNGTATITATVADGANYAYATKTASYTLTVGTAAMNVTATGYTGTFDGKAHSITVTAPAGATVKYGTTAGTYNLDASPTYTNAGNYTVYYQVTKAGYTAVTGSQTVTIAKAAAAISFATASVGKTFGDAAFTNALTNTGDGAVTFASNNTAVATVNATTGSVNIVGNGTATITATVADGANYAYATKTASYTLTVGTAAMNVTATGYTGTFDGKAHSITVTAPAGATVKYGTTAGTYNLDASPTYTNAGNYTVYYQVTKAGYTAVTGSQTVTIAKAAAAISYTTTSIDKLDNEAAFTNALTKTGDGTVTYTSSNTNVATVNASTGEVTIVGVGTTTITATVANGTNYTYATKTATYTLTVAASIKKYDLWIGNIQVDADNMNDILDDSNEAIQQAASFSYNPENNTLIVSADMDIDIRTSKGLTIYLAPKIQSTIGKITYIGQGAASLTFATDGNFPGKLTLSTASGNVINGFSELILNQNLGIINNKGKELAYANNTLATTDATIGICINPLVEEKIVTPTEEKFTDKNGEDVDLSNTVIDDILYTLNVSNDDGYNTDDNSIHLNTVMSDNEVEQAIKHTPGSESFSGLFTGMTFIVPAGEGLIRINAQVESGYVIKVKIGNNPAQEFTSLSFNNPIPYNVEDPTFVYIYNGGQNISGVRSKIIKPGKKTVGHVKVFNVTISPQTVKAANPVGNVSGGEYKGEIPPVGQNMTEPDIIESGIATVRADIDTRNGKWYNLNGQQIDEPKQKGLYIHNGQKVYIK